jgi:hypothetical protein
MLSRRSYYAITPTTPELESGLENPTYSPSLHVIRGVW